MKKIFAFAALLILPSLSQAGSTLNIECVGIPFLRTALIKGTIVTGDVNASGVATASGTLEMKLFQPGHEDKALVFPALTVSGTLEMVAADVGGQIVDQRVIHIERSGSSAPDQIADIRLNVDSATTRFNSTVRPTGEPLNYFARCSVK